MMYESWRVHYELEDQSMRVGWSMPADVKSISGSRCAKVPSELKRRVGAKPNQRLGHLQRGAICDENP